MRKLVIIILFYCLLLSANISFAQNTWFEQQTGYSINRSVECVHFFNSQKGFIAGGFGVLAYTTNSGVNWIKINNSNDNHYHSIFFIDDNTGWFTGGFWNYSSVIELIRKTTDGGVTWDSTYIDPGARIYDIQFLNNNTGYLAGKYIRKTTNGGYNWFSVESPAQYFFNNSIYFVNEHTGWVSKSYTDPYIYITTSKILKTTNGGQNWFNQIVDSNLTHNIFNDIHFVNNLTGYLAGVAIFKTTNGGQNWFAVSDSSLRYYKLFFINDNTGWASSWNYVSKTTNAGNTWVSEFITYGCFFRGMYFLNLLTGWVSGMTNISQPKLYKTTNGGVSYINSIGNVMPDIFYLHQNYPNPFNPVTNIKFDIPKNGFVTLKVFDILGREITTLVNEKLSAGSYEWEWDGNGYPSSVYFYRLVTDDFSEVKKMLLIK